MGAELQCTAQRARPALDTREQQRVRPITRRDGDNSARQGGHEGAARGAGTVVVLGRAGPEGEAALARVVAAYAEGTGGYSAQARPTTLDLSLGCKGLGSTPPAPDKQVILRTSCTAGRLAACLSLPSTSLRLQRF